MSNTDQINHVRKVMSDPEDVTSPSAHLKTRPPDRPSTIPRDDVSGGDALTEDYVALLFSQKYGQAARYDHDLGRWALWDSATFRWQWDSHQTASHWCRELSREASEGKASKVLERVRKRSFHSGVEAMCRADPRHAVNHDVWDADDMLLGCPGVTIDLRTGKGRPPRPDDMISRLTAVAPDPGMRTPKWDAFIDAVTQGDDSLARFLQAFAGYTLTGSVKEHEMLFFHGDGGNGKSLLLNTIVGIMGEYAQVASMDTFASSRFERHSTDLAAMRGARLVAVSEVAAGVGWNQQRLTQMTGGDKVRARFMRQDEFEYAPKFKLWVVGNHKPELGNVTDAMRRRMNIIPFSKKIENPDRDLFESLRAEWPGILQWAIRGCLDWQWHGFSKPDLVRMETEDYFGQQDTFGQWLEECCRLDKADANHWDTAIDLYQSWKDFAEVRSAEAGSAKTFGELLKAKGYQPGRKTVGGKTARVWMGVALIRDYGSGY